MTLDVQLAENDFHALLDNVRLSERTTFRAPTLDLVVAWLALVALFVAAYLKRALHFPSLVFGIGLVWAGTAWFRRRCMKRVAPSANSPFFIRSDTCLEARASRCRPQNSRAR